MGLDMRLCVECRHYKERGEGFGVQLLCERPIPECGVSPVTGKRILLLDDVYAERRDGVRGVAFGYVVKKCGHVGQYWEPRNAND